LESSDLKHFLDQEGMVVPFDKPLGWTSFDVVNKVRVFLKYRYGIPKVKTGHAGTLDPLATGLLLICIGKATRSIQTLQELPKTYTGTILLGSVTPSLDAETEVSETCPTAHITHEMIYQAAAGLTGTIRQTPPLFSAIKLDGKRAYKMARNNEEIVIPDREVVIHSFNIIRIDGDTIHFEISCSKGTYIRSVARDIGRMLDSCGYLTSLQRTSIGHFHLENAKDINTLGGAFEEFGFLQNPPANPDDH
jgi:tRNA pseudouridine55 synthase